MVLFQRPRGHSRRWSSKRKDKRTRSPPPPPPDVQRPKGHRPRHQVLSWPFAAHLGLFIDSRRVPANGRHPSRLRPSHRVSVHPCIIHLFQSVTDTDTDMKIHVAYGLSHSHLGRYQESTHTHILRHTGTLLRRHTHTPHHTPCIPSRLTLHTLHHTPLLPPSAYPSLVGRVTAHAPLVQSPIPPVLQRAPPGHLWAC